MQKKIIISGSDLKISGYGGSIDGDVEILVSGSLEISGLVLIGGDLSILEKPSVYDGSASARPIENETEAPIYGNFIVDCDDTISQIRGRLFTYITSLSDSMGWLCLNSDDSRRIIYVSDHIKDIQLFRIYLNENNAISQFYPVIPEKFIPANQRQFEATGWDEHAKEMVRQIRLYRKSRNE